MKREFTIGAIAKIINVARSTVINWIKDGRLKAFQLPGGNNRVTREDLISFMQHYNIPLSFLDEAGGKRLLIVDDDTELLSSLAAALRREGGFEVETACNGFQAGISTWEFRPHIVLLDIGLDDIDGRDICRTLVANPELSLIKIIGISGMISAEEAEELENIGFAGFVKKPFSPQEILKVIQGILSPS